MLDMTSPGSVSLPQDHPCYNCEVRRLSIAQGLTCKTLADLRSMGFPVHLDAGQALFRQADASDRVYTLASGSLRLYQLLADGRRCVTGFILPGDFLGISMESRYAVTAEALEESRLWSFSRSQFNQFAESHLPLRDNLYRIAAHDLMIAQRQIALLARKTAIERLSTFLFDLLVRYERLAASRLKAITLPMSRSDIADDLGLTKETVSRLLTQLKRERVIRIDGLDHLTILDRDRLIALGDSGQTASF